MIRISCSIVLLTLLFFLSALSQHKKNANRQARKVEEFGEIKRRAETIQESLASSDPEIVKQGYVDQLSLI